MTLDQTSNSARAFWVTGPSRGEIRCEPFSSPGPDEVSVRSLYSAISRGTEVLVYRGAVPRSEYQRMRAPFQVGEFPAPLKYGYISVGRVQAGVSSLVGRIVFCLHPHQTQFIVPSAAVHVLPDGVPPDRAVLAANLETAVNGLWDARPCVGDRVTVVGGGTLGCLAAWLLSGIPGCVVELVDVNRAREPIAEALGFGFAQPAEASPDADLVLHCSGTAGGLTTALGLAGFEARVVELSWYGEKDVALPLGAAFHTRRLQLVCSQVGSVATCQRARWDAKRRMRLALRLLIDPRLDALITGEGAFEDLPRIMARLSADPGDSLCHRIRFD